MFRDEELEADVVDATLGTVLKYYEDIERVRDEGLDDLVAATKHEAARITEVGR